MQVQGNWLDLILACVMSIDPSQVKEKMKQAYAMSLNFLMVMSYLG